jgi:hypothetical protein
MNNHKHRLFSRLVIVALFGLGLGNALATDPSPSTCNVTWNHPGGGIVEKYCHGGCNLDPGCCQKWRVQEWGTNNYYWHIWCAGTAYNCDTSSHDWERCIDAFGNPALPPL